MGGFATVAGLEGCAKRGVLGGPSDRRSSLAFRLIWGSGRGLDAGAGGPSPLSPLIWARRSPIWVWLGCGDSDDVTVRLTGMATGCLNMIRSNGERK